MGGAVSSRSNRRRVRAGVTERFLHVAPPGREPGKHDAQHQRDQCEPAKRCHQHRTANRQPAAQMHVVAEEAGGAPLKAARASG